VCVCGNVDSCSWCCAISCSHRYPCPGCTTIKINCCQIDHWPNIVSISSSNSSNLSLYLLYVPPPFNPPTLPSLALSRPWHGPQVKANVREASRAAAEKHEFLLHLLSIFLIFFSFDWECVVCVCVCWWKATRQWQWKTVIYRRIWRTLLKRKLSSIGF